MSHNPRDLSVSMRCVRSPQHVLNGGPEGSTFPGWFVTAQQNEGYDLVAIKQITETEAIVIADVIDRTIDRTDKSHWLVTNAVKRCNNAMRDELERQLKTARIVAARIPDLERRLGKDGA